MASGVKQILDYDDYAAIPPDGKRYELLEGDVHVTPAPSPRHQWSSKKLQRQLEDSFEAGGLGRVFNAPIDVILGALLFRRPDGRPLSDLPPPVAVPADPVQTLRARHETLGLQLHARTACPRWLGERLDLVWAIDVLHPLATHGVGSRA